MLYRDASEVNGEKFHSMLTDCVNAYDENDTLQQARKKIDAVVKEYVNAEDIDSIKFHCYTNPLHKLCLHSSLYNPFGLKIANDIYKKQKNLILESILKINPKECFSSQADTSSIIHLLSRGGAFCYGPVEEGFRPLHTALQGRKECDAETKKTIEILHAHGCNLDLKSLRKKSYFEERRQEDILEHQETAAGYAARNGNFTAVFFLASLGADLSIADQEGKTPSDHAGMQEQYSAANRMEYIQSARLTEQNYMPSKPVKESFHVKQIRSAFNQRKHSEYYEMKNEKALRENLENNLQQYRARPFSK